MAETWREHPKLKGHFHPEYPDDIQVIIHDGGPRLTRVAPEVAWVRITYGEGDLFTGTVLNKPTALTTIAAGSSIRFKVPESGELPLMVTEKYLLERSEWIIHPCSKCGLTELFDAPSDLIRVVFPSQQEDFVPEMFTAFCGFCGGTQVVQRSAEDPAEGPTAVRPKKWWEFWR